MEDRPEFQLTYTNEGGLTKEGKKAMKIVMIVIFAIMVIMFSILGITHHKDQQGIITQEIWQDHLYTSLKYKGETLFVDYDEIELDTNMDSIKCVRYNYCIQLLEKTRELDKFKCK